MKRYFIKTLLNGWKEVTEENFNRFIKILSETEKHTLIASRTRIIKDY